MIETMIADKFESETLFALYIYFFQTLKELNGMLIDARERYDNMKMGLKEEINDLQEGNLSKQLESIRSIHLKPQNKNQSISRQKRSKYNLFGFQSQKAEKQLKAYSKDQIFDTLNKIMKQYQTQGAREFKNNFFTSQTKLNFIQNKPPLKHEAVGRLKNAERIH